MTGRKRERKEVKTKKEKMADPGNKGMEQMIPLINKLQDAFQQTGQGIGLKLMTSLILFMTSSMT